MISFKKYTLLREAFQLPYNVIQPILDYYYESFKKFLKAGREKVTPKLFPEKNFKLDFSGTNFEFLNEMDPNVNVYFLHDRSSNTSAYFTTIDRNRVNTFDKTNTGNIYINLTSKFESMYYGTIEHEVLHYVQYLIGKYKKLKKRQDEYGGLPSKKLIPSGMTTRGKIKERRTHHEYRPIEYYTNLMSAIRSLELAYEREMRKDPTTYDQNIKNKKSKKEFLNYVLKIVREGKRGSSEYSQLLDKIKKFSPEIYQKYLQIIYKVFVEGEPAYSLADVRKMKLDIGETRAIGTEEKYKRKMEKRKKEESRDIQFFTWSRDSLMIKNYDTYDIFDKSPVDIDDGRGISGEEILENLGLKSRELKDREGWSDSFYYLLPKRPSSIAKLFRNLKSLKNKPWTYELRIHQKGEKNREPTKEEMIQIYDGVYKELKDRYLNAAIDISKEPLQKLIDAAYL